MGIPVGYFTRRFGKLKAHKSKDGVSIDLDFTFLGKKIDYAQDALDAQVWQDVQRYMPFASGSLFAETDRLNKTVRGEVYFYPPDSDYGHYMYEGEIYEDPVYHVGGFYGILPGKEGQWWSRKDVTKVPSGRPLTYTNPSAVDHWGDYATKMHLKEWEQVARRALK